MTQFPSPLVLVPLAAALIAQYVMIFLAATTVNSRLNVCIFDKTPKLDSRYNAGWQKGVCMTEEQVWCRAHMQRHPDCATADCRAEEVRLVHGGVRRAETNSNRTSAPPSHPLVQYWVTMPQPALPLVTSRLCATCHTSCT